MIDNHHRDNLFLQSALNSDGEYISIQETLVWLKEQNNKVDISITRTELKKIDNWDYKDGFIKHKTGMFYSIEGLKVSSNCLNNEWQQPIINQSEVGYLGIITKKINGILHFLLQAKIEPGNINYVQLSPTLQATYSNWTKVHNGRSPLYLNYFINAKKEHILIDQ